jgi:hypothetical protein
MELAVALLSDPGLDVLINSEGAFEELPHDMQRLATQPGDTLVHRVTYGTTT